MRFRVDRNMLADAVVWTARALPTRPAVPILAGMRLEATEQLRLSSFDYEVSAEASLDLVDVEETGSALVSCWRWPRSPGACPRSRCRSRRTAPRPH